MKLSQFTFTSAVCVGHDVARNMWKLVDNQLKNNIRYILHKEIYHPINTHIWKVLQIPISIKTTHILMRT